MKADMLEIRGFYITVGGNSMACSVTNVESWNGLLASKGPEAILKWGFATFGPHDIALACGFGAEGMVILDIVMRLNPRVRKFTIDSGKLFKETYALMDRVEAHYKTKIERIRPDEQKVKKMLREYGENPATYMDICCNVRKLEPFKRAVTGMSAWISGVRKMPEVTSRKNAQPLEWDTRHNGSERVLVVNPLACWTEQQVWSYIRANNVPYNRLHDQNYASIGCEPCTAPGKGREGRWPGSEKTECGIRRQLPVTALQLVATPK